MSWHAQSHYDPNLNVLFIFICSLLMVVCAQCYIGPTVP